MKFNDIRMNINQGKRIESTNGLIFIYSIDFQQRLFNRGKIVFSRNIARITVYLYEKK